MELTWLVVIPIRSRFEEGLGNANNDSQGKERVFKQVRPWALQQKSNAGLAARSRPLGSGRAAMSADLKGDTAVVRRASGGTRVELQHRSASWWDRGGW
jgi:hypothetical protein